MPQLPHVAIVLLNYNGSEYLQKFLPGIIQSTYKNKSIFVIDNASSDTSLQTIQQFPSVTSIVLPHNIGFAGAYNAGLKAIRADYYILLNTDVEVTAGFIEPVIELMEEKSAIAICQPKILSYHDSTMFEYGGAAGGWIDLLGFQFARGRMFDKLEKDNGQYNDNAPIFWACGACLFVKASVFHQLGGFYEYYFMHSEETDLCWRAQNEGYKVYCCADSAIYHVGGAYLAYNNPRKTYLNMRNNMVMLTRNLMPLQALFIIPVRLLINITIAFGFLLVKLQPRLCVAIITAQAAYLKWLFFVSKKQMPRKKGRKDVSGIYKGFVLWDFLVRKKQTFMQLTANKS